MRVQNLIVAVVDVAGFSNFASRLSPEQLVEGLRGYIDLTHQIVAKSGGEVVTFMGDASICVWEVSADPGRQAEIGTGLVQLYTSSSNFVLPNGVRIRPRMGIAAGEVARTDPGEFQGQQVLPLFGATVTYAQRLNSGGAHFKVDVLVAQDLPVIWPAGVTLTKVADIEIVGRPGTHPIYTLAGAAL